jgi:hypothetical protein
MILYSSGINYLMMFYPMINNTPVGVYGEYENIKPVPWYDYAATTKNTD